MKRRIGVTVNKEVDLKFRELASRRLEYTHGWYSKAVEEAMRLWIEKEEE